MQNTIEVVVEKPIEEKKEQVTQEEIKNDKNKDKNIKTQETVSIQASNQEEDKEWTTKELKKMFEEQLNKKQSKIQKLERELALTKIEVDKMREQNQKQWKQFLQIRDYLQPLVIERKQFECFHHSYNPHSVHFSLHFTTHSMRITKSSDNLFHGFISNLPIKAGQVTTFTIKIIKVAGGECYLGVGTKAVFGDPNCWNRELLSLYCGDGDVCQNGMFRHAGDTIDNGQHVNIRVDLQAQQVTWTVDNKLMAEAAVPEHMRDRQLYLTLLMKHKGDELELLF